MVYAHRGAIWVDCASMILCNLLISSGLPPPIRDGGMRKGGLVEGHEGKLRGCKGCEMRVTHVLSRFLGL